MAEIQTGPGAVGRLTVERIEKRRTLDGGWIRIVFYTDRDAFPDRVHLLNEHDESPAWSLYTPACASCWLGHSHSTAKHCASV